MQKKNVKSHNIQGNDSETYSSNWGKYSDNYIVGTAPNGYTVLASRPAVYLSLRVFSEKKHLRQANTPSRTK